MTHDKLKNYLSPCLLVGSLAFLGGAAETGVGSYRFIQDQTAFETAKKLKPDVLDSRRQVQAVLTDQLNQLKEAAEFGEKTAKFIQSCGITPTESIVGSFIEAQARNSYRLTYARVGMENTELAIDNYIRDLELSRNESIARIMQGGSFMALGGLAVGLSLYSSRKKNNF